jgi:hypothetical protein
MEYYVAAPDMFVRLKLYNAPQQSYAVSKSPP